MYSTFHRWTIALALVAGLGIAGTLLALPQDEAHHPEQAQEGEQAAATQCPMAQHMAMMQGMMGRMAAHMDMMGEMPGPMHGQQDTGMMGQMHGQQGDSMMGGPGMTGEMPMMGNMMGGMMTGLMAQTDPADIDDPALADQRAERLETMVERMRDHIEQLEARAAALRERAAALRDGS